MSETYEKSKPVFLNDLYLEDENLILDPNADPFQSPPPTPDGIHLVKLALFRRNGNSAFEAGKDKRGRPYIMAHVVGTVIAEGKPYNNAKLFDRVSTVVFSSSGTCRMAGVLRALGVSVPPQTTMKQFARTFEATIEGEPLVGAETQWQARAQHGDAWVTFLRGMKKFPLREDGSHNHVVVDPETSEQVTAQATILRYLPVSQVRG